MESSTRRTNPVKAALRNTAYCLLEEALHMTGIDERHREPFTDRGDGLLALILPADEVPKTLLLNRLIPVLAALVASYNATGLAKADPQRQLRLRTVLHAGEIHHDCHGTFGEDLDIAFRLLDAPQVKRTLRHTSAPLVLVVSDYIFRSVVRHDYEGIDHHSYGLVAQVQVAGQLRQGWVHIPRVTPSLPRAQYTNAASADKGLTVSDH